MTTQFYVSAEVEVVWRRILSTCNNPLGLTEELLQQSLETAPPIPYQGSTHLGRYLIPRQFVRYDETEQPRDKNNDADHVNNLVNNYEAIGYRLDAQPPICCFDENDVSNYKLKAQSGFNRNEALGRIGQDCYFFDVYRFESKYWEVVARNQSNHHSNPQLSQKWTDYVKEVCNAVDADIIPSDSKSIDEFVDLIASDKTSKVRRRIKDACYNNCQVFPNFRTYNSSGHGKNTLNGFVKESGLPKQGIEGRIEKELLEQGYIVYCAAQGNNKSTWARAITHATKLGIPVWFIGYSDKRVDDLQEFRSDYIKDFNDQKETFVQFAKDILDDGGELIEDSFQVKLAGFMPQYVKPNPKDKGLPTEVGLVDMYGKTIKFDPDGDCLTLSQPYEDEEDN